MESGKRTSVIGLPTNCHLVERGAQILGVCGEAGLSFGSVELLGPNLRGNKIELPDDRFDRYVMYGMSDFEDGVNHPDVRLVTAEGVKDEPSSTFIAVVCLAIEESWRIFAHIVDGERSNKMKELILLMGVRNLRGDGVSVDADEGKRRVRDIASWAAKQIPIGQRKDR